MSIKSLFQNIAAAIKTKDSSIVALTPAQMPQAILDITTGAVIMTEAEWNLLPTATKQTYGLVGIIQNVTGYERGILVNGADYRDFEWDNIKTLIFKGQARSTSSSYVQLGDIRFKNTNNEYLPTQYNNIQSYSTKYGNFLDNYTRALFDNDAGTKCISNGGSLFEWTTTFSNPLTLANYSILEFWTANDSSERDPVQDIELTFIDEYGKTKNLILGDISMTTNRMALGYTNNNYQNEGVG